MNTVILTGNLTKDIEIAITKTGKAVAQFNIGVKRDKETSDFPTCVAWGKTAEILEKYCHKGSKIGVNGSIQTSKYEKDGQTIYKTIVAVSSIELLNSKQEEAPQPREAYFSAKATTGYPEYPEYQDIDANELPF